MCISVAGSWLITMGDNTGSFKPGVHTNDFAPIHRLRALKLGHASLATVFRPGRLTLQPILRENLESPGLKVSANHNRCRYWCVSKHQMAPWCIHISCFERVARSGSGRDSVRGLVGAMDAELSRPDWLATVQSGRKQVQSRVCTPSFIRFAQLLARICHPHDGQLRDTQMCHVGDKLSCNAV